MNAFKRESNLYTKDELKTIKAEWSRDKAIIDADPAYSYYWDRDAEYEKYLHNSNLRALFRHAAKLYKQYQENDYQHLYPDEIPLITDVYRRILENGYYSESKSKEKRARLWLAKAVSRQYYLKYKKR
ncbi:MAG: hypothetical protein A3F16_08740 [Deltaproteobacteria bacterium RIFCSPHIGHO2_12_FULL_43_9]|nr:MAG: hypothetical protein A3F16_08740 [Deltaproteobacteria bacterium RIFCSPHIGHO2_12_FULL_43_9]